MLHLPALSDAVRERRPCQKGPSQRADRRAKVTAEAKAEKEAKAARWRICEGQCEWRVNGRRCGKRIRRVGLDMLNHAICHHVVFRSHLSPADKWKVENLRYICRECDEAIHRRGPRR